MFKNLLKFFSSLESPFIDSFAQNMTLKHEKKQQLNTQNSVRSIIYSTKVYWEKFPSCRNLKMAYIFESPMH